MKIDIRLSENKNLFPVLDRGDGLSPIFGLLNIAVYICQSMENAGRDEKKKLLIDATDAERICQDFFEFRQNKDMPF
jgi:hypothetical protein